MIDEWDAWKRYTANDHDTRLNLYAALRKTNPRPNREGLKILLDMETKQFPSYPRRCILDRDKFAYLRQLFLKNTIKEDMFIEFSQVIDLGDRRDVQEEVNETLWIKLADKLWGDL